MKHKLNIDNKKNETYEIYDNNKYIATFFFSIFKLIEKVRKFIFYFSII